LATISKIPFTEGGFSGIKKLKMAFVFRWGSTPDSLGKLSRSPVNWEGAYPFPFPFFLKACSLSMSDPVFKKIMITLQS